LKQSSDLADWPMHLHPIFAAIGRTMGDASLQPAMLSLTSYLNIQDHEITVAHISGEQAKPGSNRYSITTKGPAIDGKWAFRSGTLDQLARSAAANS
jgi:hypothetical protein